LEEVNEVMGNPAAFPGSRLRCPDIQKFVDLPGIGGFDLAAEQSGEMKGNLRLSRRRRAHEDKHPRFPG
jgi:hypothetical protein